MAVVSCPALLLPLCRLKFSSSEFGIPPLPSGIMYGGPTAAQSNLCECNTVVYSLVSACAACQGGSWILYAFHFAHTKSMPMMFYQVVRLVGQLY